MQIDRMRAIAGFHSMGRGLSTPWYFLYSAHGLPAKQRNHFGEIRFNSLPTSQSARNWYSHNSFPSLSLLHAVVFLVSQFAHALCPEPSETELGVLRWIAGLLLFLTPEEEETRRSVPSYSEPLLESPDWE